MGTIFRRWIAHQAALSKVERVARDDKKVDRALRRAMLKGGSSAPSRDDKNGGEAA